MAERFRDKVVVVTGASSPFGIGAACARHFAREGARVVLAARGAGGLEAVAKEIREAGGEASAVPTDVTDLAACEALLDAAVETYGGLDVLVNNAAMNDRGVVEEREPARLAELIAVNLSATMVLTRLALPHLRRRGGGAIVQVASLAGRFALAGEAAYCASKSGVRAFSFALAEELRGSGISVSCVSPGPVDTAFLRDEIETVPDMVFANPMVQADDVAKVVLQCALDGRRERAIPVSTGLLAYLGAAFPVLRRWMEPIMERRGRAKKSEFLARQPASPPNRR